MEISVFFFNNNNKLSLLKLTYWNKRKCVRMWFSFWYFYFSLEKAWSKLNIKLGDLLNRLKFKLKLWKLCFSFRCYLSICNETVWRSLRKRETLMFDWSLIRISEKEKTFAKMFTYKMCMSSAHCHLPCRLFRCFA